MCRLAVVLLLAQFFLNDFCSVLSYKSDIYCNSEICSDKGTHIACHNNGTMGEECNDDAKLEPITTSFMNFILSTINKIRNKLARGLVPGYPPASRMLTVQWDDELAKLAELSVKRCSTENDDCRNTKSFEHVGQIISRVDEMSRKLDVKATLNTIIKSWRDTSKLCDTNIIESYQLPGEGHDCSPFVQLAQSRASHVGCAMLSQTDGGTAFIYLTCNFSHGNIGGRKVYESGRGGKLCSRGTHITYQFLCSELELLDINAI